MSLKFPKFPDTNGRDIAFSDFNNPETTKALVWLIMKSGFIFGLIWILFIAPQ